MHPKDADRMANSVDPDQTAPSDLSVQKLWIIMVNFFFFFFQSYKRRWYILLVYGLMAMTQCSVWNTFGPITEVSERVFGWNDGDISLLTNWGPISYVVGTFAFSWILDEKGMFLILCQMIFFFFYNYKQVHNASTGITYRTRTNFIQYCRSPIHNTTKHIYRILKEWYF